jgi:hypothetical protein
MLLGVEIIEQEIVDFRALTSNWTTVGSIPIECHIGGSCLLSGGKRRVNALESLGCVYVRLRPGDGHSVPVYLIPVMTTAVWNEKPV